MAQTYRSVARRSISRSTLTLDWATVSSSRMSCIDGGMRAWLAETLDTGASGPWLSSAAATHEAAMADVEARSVACELVSRLPHQRGSATASLSSPTRTSMVRVRVLTLVL